MLCCGLNDWPEKSLPPFWVVVDSTGKIEVRVVQAALAMGGAPYSERDGQERLVHPDSSARCRPDCRSRRPDSRCSSARRATDCRGCCRAQLLVHDALGLTQLPIAGNFCVGGLLLPRIRRARLHLDGGDRLAVGAVEDEHLARLAAVVDRPSSSGRRPGRRRARATRCPCPRCRAGSPGSATCTRRSWRRPRRSSCRTGCRPAAAGRPGTNRSCARCRSDQ